MSEEAKNPRSEAMREEFLGELESLRAWCRPENRLWHSGPSDEGDALMIAAYQLNTATRAWVRAVREEGLTWAQIGDALGVSKQAAQQRYGA